jgi:hypothetical protein
VLEQTVGATSELLSLSFGSAGVPHGVEVLGEAHTTDLALVLTDSLPEQAGSFVISRPQPELPLLWLGLTLQALIGGGREDGGAHC